MLDVTVRSATLADLQWLVHLRDRPAQRDAGYIPTGGLVEHVEHGRCTLIDVAGQQGGFVIHRHRQDGIVHVPSVCIDEELWRLGYGSELMQEITAKATAAGARAITLKCAFDASADAFWPTLGFRHVVTTAGRKRVLKGWSMSLADPTAIVLPPRSQWGCDRILARLPRPEQTPPPSSTAIVTA